MFLTATAPAGHYLPCFLVYRVLPVPAAGAFSITFAFARAAALEVHIYTIRFVLGRAAVECSKQGLAKFKGFAIQRPVLGPEAPQ